MAADILITDLTNGNIIQNIDGDYVWEGTGVFDTLIKAVNSNIKIEYDNGRITGSDYANVYLGAIQSVIAQAMQYTLQEKLVEAQIDTELSKKLSIDKDTQLKDVQIQEEQYKLTVLLPDEHNKNLQVISKLTEEIDLLQTQDAELQANGISDRALKAKQVEVLDEDRQLKAANVAAKNYQNTFMLPIQKDKLAEEYSLMLDTHAHKVTQASNSARKVGNDADYVAEQKIQLVNSVTYNNKIKALQTLGDTYGTFGAGGLTLSADMWSTYFSIVNDLSAATVPTSTTVTKV